jgi:proteasome lid subunit RPN8/RPN11
MDDVLWSECIDEATRKLPNETCGLFVSALNEGKIRLIQFSEQSTPWQVTVNPQAVIDFAYSLHVGSTPFRVLSTFHTHPEGGTHPSVADKGLALWAHTHLILFRSLSRQTDGRLDSAGSQAVNSEQWEWTWWGSHISK